MSDEPVYEMFWDCPFCGAKELLGLTHRHCPSCGAPQDPSKRYYPDEDKKVAVGEHRFVGADFQCANCGTPCAASVSNCPNCGSPAGEGQPHQAVGLVADAQVGGTPETPPAAGAADGEGGSSITTYIVIGVIAALIIGVCGFFFWKGEKHATVIEHSWRFVIPIERFDRVRDSKFCDELPPGARVLRRTERQRGTRQVQDGEECTSRNVDNGDGTFRRVQDCRPRMRSEPQMAPFCEYEAEEWVAQREVTSQGEGTNPAPSWPRADVDNCRRLGCTREGRRQEHYSLTLDVEGMGRQTCEVSADKWRQFENGSRVDIDVGVVSDSIDCSDLRPVR